MQAESSQGHVALWERRVLCRDLCLQPEQQIVTPLKYGTTSPLHRLHLYHCVALLSAGRCDQLGGQSTNYRRLTSFSQQAEAVRTCHIDWKKLFWLNLQARDRGWQDWLEGVLLSVSVFLVFLCHINVHKTHSLSIFTTFFSLIRKRLGLCVFVCVFCFYSSVRPCGHSAAWGNEAQHSGTGPLVWHTLPDYFHSHSCQRL